MTQTYEAWRITYQSSEQAARAAFERMMELKSSKCLHQIAEPAAPVVKPIKDAIDALVMAAFTEGGCSEHRMSEARIQTELRKKELRTEIARLTNALARANAAAPQAVQAVQAAVPATNHSETPNSSTIIVPYGWKLVPDDATPEWVTNLEALPDWREAVGECIKRFLAAAPAHPAEGVPAMAAPFAEVLTDEDMEDFVSTHGFTGDFESMARIVEEKVLEKVAATQPAAQGVMVNMTPPATSRDRWMYEQGRLAEREIICAAIKAEDDHCVDQGDYMLDSEDCIKIVRGEWERPDFSGNAAQAKQGGV